MKSLIVAALVSVSALISVRAQALDTAQPIAIKPTADQAICLKREYSEDHLRQYPKQKLSSMYIIVRVAKVDANLISKDDDGAYDTYTAAEVIGQKATGDKSYYANWDSTCQYSGPGVRRGGAHCFVECDGGSFDLLPRPTDVLFSVAKDYYFPLYRPGKSRETATDADTISLNAKDQHNAIYRLYQAPVKECVEARKRAKKIQGDC